MKTDTRVDTTGDSRDSPTASENQPTPPSHVVEFAVEVAGWSPCRSKRGAVLFSGDDILGHGYNYKPRGFECDGSAACKATCRVEAIHAEQQALLAFNSKAGGAEMIHAKSVNGRLVPSGGPSCVQCSKFIVACGVEGVWLYHATGWRRYNAAEFHDQSLQAQSPAAREAGCAASSGSSPMGGVEDDTTDPRVTSEETHR
jgi:deoxycytidylate deaminase